MSRPLWGKVAGVSLTEGGNSLTNIDCLQTNAPTPTTAVQTNRITHGRPYNTASELSLSEPSRAHLSPKGEAKLFTVKPVQNLKAVPLGGRGTASAVEGGNSLSILDCPPTNAPIPTPTTQTKPHYTCKAIQPRKRAPPLRALTGPPLPKGRGLLYEPRK